MAIITASYPGNCAVCHQRYVAGTQINWTKGGPTSHVACSGGASSSSDPKRSAGVPSRPVPPAALPQAKHAANLSVRLVAGLLSRGTLDPLR